MKLSNPREFCSKLDQWAKLVKEQPSNVSSTFSESWSDVRLAISKSCLLDRTLYGDENPSQTPCPVHKGRWSGCHFMWPGNVWINVNKPPDFIIPSAQCQEWYDQGCRCAYHSCGCTTGWQPDEHCGCGGEDRLIKQIFEEYGIIYK